MRRRYPRRACATLLGQEKDAPARSGPRPRPRVASPGTYVNRMRADGPVQSGTKSRPGGRRFELKTRGAAGLGLEPRLADPESAGLPLPYPAPSAQSVAEGSGTLADNGQFAVADGHRREHQVLGGEERLQVR